MILLLDKFFNKLQFNGIFNNLSIIITGKYLIILFFFLTVKRGLSLIIVFDVVRIA